MFQAFLCYYWQWLTPGQSVKTKRESPLLLLVPLVEAVPIALFSSSSNETSRRICKTISHAVLVAWGWCFTHQWASIVAMPLTEHWIIGTFQLTKGQSAINAFEYVLPKSTSRLSGNVVRPLSIHRIKPLFPHCKYTSFSWKLRCFALQKHKSASRQYIFFTVYFSGSVCLSQDYLRTLHSIIK